MKRPQNITVLGATGSIGMSTLDVIRRHPDRFRAYALSAHVQTERLHEQCLEFHPEYAVMSDADCAEKLRAKIESSGLGTTVLCGVEALEKIASLDEVDAVMAAIVGAAGMRPTLAAAAAGKKILLANKETLVMAGALFMDQVAKSGAILLPIDSEHNAIFQVLPRDISKGLANNGVSRILLTASGGPFRTRSRDQLRDVTPEQACAHPNWSMGRKISVDSATMMNKGLEVIEAHWLFGASADEIGVVVHPQSVIHSMVQYLDGSVLAQLGNPDMRTPIAYALGYPERIDSGVAPLDLFEIARLDFEQPDFSRFPCLRLAFEALRHGNAAPTVLNAANEVAVEAFLGGRLAFTRIPELIESVLLEVPDMKPDGLETILAIDAEARAAAHSWLSRSL